MAIRKTFHFSTVVWGPWHTGVFLDHAPTGRAFRIPALSVYEQQESGPLFTRETVYYDSASLFGQLGLPVPEAAS